MHGAALVRAQATFGLQVRSAEVMHGAALVRAQSPFGFSPHRKKVLIAGQGGKVNCFFRLNEECLLHRCHVLLR